MPFAGAILASQVFSGIPTEGVLEGEPPARLPVGFDAAAQFSRKLLQASLGRVLHAAGMASIDIRRPFGADALPASVASALSALVHPLETAGAQVELAVEFRLTDARLRALGERNVPPVIGGASAASAVGGIQPKPAEIAWAVELNLLRIKREQVLDPGRRARGRFFDDIVADIGDGVLDPGGSTPPAANVTRTRVASGVAVTRAPTVLVPRLDLLQMWLEFDLAASSTAMETSEPLMADLLAASIGQSWFEATVARLTSASRLRACPRVAFGGALTAAQAASLGLTAPRGDYQVHALPNGAEILSLAASFGDDAGGLAGDLQPFIGPRDFALFVSRSIIDPVVRTRWRTNPAARQFTSDVTVRMPVSEGSETIGDGTVRVRVRLGELSEAGLMAASAPPGDVLRLVCDEDIEVLAVWWPSGEQVEELGELGDPVTVPMTVNVAPFARPASGTNVQAPFRLFLLSVLEPLAAPLLDRFEIRGMDGFVSEALDASLCRWRLPVPQDSIVGDFPGGGVFQP
jgi:hypothetical protein